MRTETEAENADESPLPPLPLGPPAFNVNALMFAFLYDTAASAAERERMLNLLPLAAQTLWCGQ